MFIFISHEDVIEADKIIAILDYQLYHTSFQLRKLIEARNKENKVIGNQKEAKSIVITVDDIYFSSLSTFTLKKREELSSAMSHIETYEYETK